MSVARSAVQDSVDPLTFGNNSSVRVSTSMRSGTLQYLHVSEFGKICAQAPEKAREIVTGALNTVEAGQFVVIESTAEGQEGAFYEMAQHARARALGPSAHYPRLPVPLLPVVARRGLRPARPGGRPWIGGRALLRAPSGGRVTLTPCPEALVGEEGRDARGRHEAGVSGDAGRGLRAGPGGRVLRPGPGLCS